MILPRIQKRAPRRSRRRLPARRKSLRTRRFPRTIRVSWMKRRRRWKRQEDSSSRRRTQKNRPELQLIRDRAAVQPGRIPQTDRRLRIRMQARLQEPEAEARQRRPEAKRSRQAIVQQWPVICWRQEQPWQQEIWPIREEGNGGNPAGKLKIRKAESSRKKETAESRVTMRMAARFSLCFYIGRNYRRQGHCEQE